jgi:hypothetical protein
MFFRSNRSRLPAGINQWIVDRKLKIELILALLAFVAILIHSFDQEMGTEIMMVTMSSLAAFYFILGYTTPDVVDRFSHLLFRVISISAAVGIIGLLFSIMRFSGSDEMIQIGFYAMIISGLILFYYVLKRGDTKLHPLLFPTVVLGLLLALAHMKIIAF